MDPYLEHPDLWPDVHHGLIEALRDFLVPRLRPKYRVAIEKRTYLAEPEGLALVGRPDLGVVKSPAPAVNAPGRGTSALAEVQPLAVTLPVAGVMTEGYLEVRDVLAGEVIATIEILSPTNKKPGQGRHSYEAKRLRVLASGTHLVEIDLLRGGEPMPIVEQGSRGGRYGILVSRSTDRPRAMLYTFGVQERIPTFPLPLAPGDLEPDVDLQVLLHQLYDRAGYDLAIDYHREPEPPLPPADAAWAASLLEAGGSR
jgi:hypothetical protein